MAQFIARWPDHEKTPRLMYASAWNHYEHNDLAAASTRFEAAIAQHPEAKEAELAV